MMKFSIPDGIDPLAALPWVGFLVMIVLPVGFVLALSLGILRESRGWYAVSLLTGFFLVAGVVLFLAGTRSAGMVAG